MDKEKIFEFYDNLFRIIGDESRNMLYDYVYEVAEKEFASRFFSGDDERHYEFQSFFEHHIERLEKEGLIVVKYKNEKPIELGLSEAGEQVCSLGYLQYKNEQEANQKRIEKENRQRTQEETNERKWNIRHNIVQIILNSITLMSIIGGWILGKTDTPLFILIIFIAGCSLGYGVRNSKKRY